MTETASKQIQLATIQQELQHDIDDGDIDAEYDWNSNAMEKKKQHAIIDDDDDYDDDDGDDDIDADYDWNSNALKVKTTDNNNDETKDDDEYIYDDNFNMNSPKFLDTPQYNTPINGKKNHQKTHSFPSIQYDDNGQTTPISVLSHLSTNTPIPDNISDIMDENKRDIIKSIDKSLSNYYQYFKRNDYFNDEHKGKFMIFCEKNNLFDTNIRNRLDSDIAYFKFDIDINFPFNFLTSDNVEIDSETQEDLMQIEIYNVLKYCYEHKISPL